MLVRHWNSFLKYWLGFCKKCLLCKSNRMFNLLFFNSSSRSLQPYLFSDWLLILTSSPIFSILFISYLFRNLRPETRQSMSVGLTVGPMAVGSIPHPRPTYECINMSAGRCRSVQAIWVSHLSHSITTAVCFPVTWEKIRVSLFTFPKEY